MIFDSEKKKTAMLGLNALAREFPEKFDAEKTVIINNLRKKFVEETVMPEQKPEITAETITREEGTALTPLINQLQQTAPGSPERLQVLQQIKSIKGGLEEEKLTDKIRLSHPQPEVPDVGKVVAGAAEGLAKGATAGHISLIDQQVEKLKEISQDAKLPKEVRKSTESMLHIAEGQTAKTKEDPLFQASEVVGEFTGFVAPITVLNKATAFIKLAKYAPQLSKSGAAALKLTEYIGKGAVTGAGFGGIRKLEKGESRVESVIKDAALFALFDGLIGLKDVSRILKAKSVEEAIHLAGGKSPAKQKELIETYEYYGDLAEHYEGIPKGHLFDSDDIRKMVQFQKEQANIERLRQSPKGAKLLSESLTHDERATLRIGKIPEIKGQYKDKHKLELGVPKKDKPQGITGEMLIGGKRSGIRRDTGVEDLAAYERKFGTEKAKELVEKAPKRESVKYDKDLKELTKEGKKTVEQTPKKVVQKQAKPTVKKVEKEPWEMTKKEFDEFMPNPYKDSQDIYLKKKQIKEKKAWSKKTDIYHKSKIEQAIKDGRPVPPNVLKNYPDLMPKPVPKVETPKKGIVTKKGIKDAFKKDNEQVGIVADPYRNVRKYLKEHDLSEESRKAIMQVISTVGKSKLLSEAKKVEKIEAFISKGNFKKEAVKAKVPIGKQVKKVKESKFLTFREQLQDHQIRIRKLQEEVGVTTDQSSNRYNAEVRFHGRVGTRLEKVHSSLNEVDKNIITTSKKAKVNEKELTKDVYSYLIARHTPERNLALGKTNATGITNVEAGEIIKSIQSKPHFKDIKKIADELTKTNKQTLDILLDGEVITAQLHNQLRNRYKHHVPLQRILEDSDDMVEVLNGGKGFNVRQSGIKGAKGSEREVADLLENIGSNVGKAIELAEKNRVNLTTLKFAKENPDLGLFEIFKPKIIGKGKDGKPIFQRIETGKGSPTLAVREKGKQIYIEIKDPVLAEAYKGTGIPAYHESPLFNVVNSFSRFISAMSTRYNPEFAVPNMVRDTQEMAVYMASQKKIGIRGATRAATRQFSSALDVMSTVWGKAKRPGAKLYEEMKMEGGTTGGLALSTKKQMTLDIAKMRKINRSNPRKAAQEVAGFFDNLNVVFEDASRLSVYKEMKNRGFNKTEAATTAKESTINFNRKGKTTPLINAAYIFANASMQGSVKMLKAMKNPKVLTGVITGTGVSSWTVNHWNDMVDSEWRDKITDWDRKSNLVILIPTEDGVENVKIPVSWGLKSFKAMWDNVYDAYNDKEKRKPLEIGADMAATILDAYNPVGGSNFSQAITPTIGDVPVALWSNTAWHGGEISPDFPYFKELPEHLKHFDKLAEKKVGKYAIDGTKKLYSNTGIDISPADMTYALEQLGGGALRAGSRLVNTIGSMGEDDLDSREMFMVNRFYKSVPGKQLEKIKQYKELGNNYYQSIQEESSLNRFERWKSANKYLDEFKEAETKESKTSILKRAYNDDPRLYERLKRDIRADKAGFTPKEKFINGLDNEIKAKVIIEEMSKLKTRQEQVKLYSDWARKK